MKTLFSFIKNLAASFLAYFNSNRIIRMQDTVDNNGALKVYSASIQPIVKKTIRPVEIIVTDIEKIEKEKGVRFVFLSPENIIYKGRNIRKFVKDYSHIFTNAEDLVIKEDGSCVASKALAALAHGSIQSWKGWSVYS